MPPPELPTTIKITNFSGNLTRIPNGDLTSGFARYSTTFGLNPFRKPSTLSFMEKVTSIKGSVITDCIVAQKEKVESGILYVYAVGHLGRVYKIQVNNPATHNPSYDNPVLLTTITINSPTFTMGGSIDFYGGFILIGHDVGVTKLAFDGTGEAFIGSTGSWMQNVPRPIKIFVGSAMVGNSNNIAEINSGFTVSTYTKLSPAFPSDYQVRDLDYTADGVYLVIATVRNLLTSILSTTPDTTQSGTIDSEIGYWNGIDSAATSFLNLPTSNLGSYLTYSSYEYVFGNDSISSSLSTPQQKILTLENLQYPLPNASFSVGNLLAWGAPEYNGVKLESSLHIFGQFDQDTTPGHQRLIFQAAALTGNSDVLRMPSCLAVSNFFHGGQNSGYTNNIISASKVYFSTIEYNGSVTDYNFYSFSLYPTGSGESVAGVYETLQQLYSQKFVAKAVRVYLEPAVTGQIFQIDLIGIDGEVLTDANGPQIFTAGTNVEIGETLAWYNPAHKPTPAIGIRITNAGTVTPVIHKIEIDIVPQGK